MPFTLRFDPATRVGVATFSGDVTGTEIAASFAELHARLTEHPGEVRTVWDMRGARSLAIAREDLDRIAAAMLRTGEIAPGRGSVVVYPHQTTIAGLGKLLLAKGATESRPRRAFTDFDEALAWVTEDP